VPSIVKIARNKVDLLRRHQLIKRRSADNTIPTGSPGWKGRDGVCGVFVVFLHVHDPALMTQVRLFAPTVPAICQQPSVKERHAADLESDRVSLWSLVTRAQGGSVTWWATPSLCGKHRLRAAQQDGNPEAEPGDR
jgi:hypothetical protein